jgi:DHA2 family multidrug resistance protein
MHGSLSASLYQVNWVITSYIVAAAIMTAPIGWLSDRFGRKKLFIACAAGFTFASLLCGIAQNIEQMVLFRLFQGMCGAALVPLSQSLMLDSYTLQERGQAMAIWGIGVMLGPIMGPTLGGWLTETYSWHWVFLVNLPVGIFTVIGLMLFMDETPRRAHLRFDWFGFLALAVGIGALQLMFDRGEQLGWFDSTEIVIEAIIAAFGFYFFFAHSLTTPEPFVRFDIFNDRNFIGGCFFMVVMGVTLFGTMALVTPFLQNVIGYPIMTAGEILATRGIGTLVAMTMVGRIMQRVEARYLVLIGLGLTAFTLYEMIGFTNMTGMQHIIVVSVIQGFGIGMVFVPLSTVAFASLPGHLRTDGTAMLTLVRNMGSAVGISIVISTLTRNTSIMHAQLTEHITPFNDALAMPDVASTIDLATSTGRALMDSIIAQQAVIIAFANDFKLLLIWTLCAIPFVALIGSSRALRRGAGTPQIAHD